MMAMILLITQQTVKIYEVPLSRFKPQSSIYTQRPRQALPEIKIPHLSQVLKQIRGNSALILFACRLTYVLIYWNSRTRKSSIATINFKFHYLKRKSRVANCNLVFRSRLHTIGEDIRATCARTLWGFKRASALSINRLWNIRGVRQTPHFLMNDTCHTGRRF